MATATARDYCPTQPVYRSSPAAVAASDPSASPFIQLFRDGQRMVCQYLRARDAIILMRTCRDWFQLIQPSILAQQNYLAQRSRKDVTYQRWHLLRHQQLRSMPESVRHSGHSSTFASFFLALVEENLEQCTPPFIKMGLLAQTHRVLSRASERRFKPEKAKMRLSRDILDVLGRQQLPLDELTTLTLKSISLQAVPYLRLLRNLRYLSVNEGRIGASHMRRILPADVSSQLEEVDMSNTVGDWGLMLILLARAPKYRVFEPKWLQQDYLTRALIPVLPFTRVRILVGHYWNVRPHRQVTELTMEGCTPHLQIDLTRVIENRLLALRELTLIRIRLTDFEWVRYLPSSLLILRLRILDPSLSTNRILFQALEKAPCQNRLIFLQLGEPNFTLKNNPTNRSMDDWKHAPYDFRESLHLNAFPRLRYCDLCLGHLERAIFELVRQTNQPRWRPEIEGETRREQEVRESEFVKQVLAMDGDIDSNHLHPPHLLTSWSHDHAILHLILVYATPDDEALIWCVCRTWRDARFTHPYPQRRVNASSNSKSKGKKKSNTNTKVQKTRAH